MNTLRDALQDYLALRRSLGYKMGDAGRLLPRFVSFLEERQAPHITARLALEWTQQGDVQRAEWARRLCFVRGFARYRSAVDALTEIPPVRLLPYRSTRAKPYLYSDDEVRHLLEAALQLPTNWPSTALRPIVIAVLNLVRTQRPERRLVGVLLAVLFVDGLLTAASCSPSC